MRAADVWVAYHSTFTVEKLYQARPITPVPMPELSHTYIAAWLQPLDSDFLNPAALDRDYWVASKAVQLDPNLPQAHASSEMCLGRSTNAAIAPFEKASALNLTPRIIATPPLIFSEKFSRAIEVLDAYIRIDLFLSALHNYVARRSLVMLKRYAE